VIYDIKLLLLLQNKILSLGAFYVVCVYAAFDDGAC
jgi:hypothetical protein